MNKQAWTVYTAVGQDIIKTVWTEEGPGQGVSTHLCSSPELAVEMAARMQQDYDRLRKSLA